MAKNKSGKMPHYELLFIVSNKFSEDEVKDVVKDVHKIITDNEGKITYTEEWGKKKLSYPIKGFQFGYYSLAEFDSSGEKVNKINNELRLSTEVLRHLIVAKVSRTAEEIQAEKKQAEKKIIAKAKAETEVVEKKEIEKPKKAIDLKDLDEKLDRILETDDLL
ncbi:MAG: 30S ribosomal protein S6 [Candidatus Falkowbacteria bacterium GW2011_GWC2_38_22]|uniref:Small ribosomal subunit protein bS6 n=1 Tax=Candidatus Falkowbacteria bacterium GW2011_GWE1_38_31 TaxID=1618638 RepID=A0A0G0M9A4_9BACT|nr:MAG: 30S ribosomal protein S6 [Candidatus Falkowbacteria bacterium GW2011_GWF2_38_1205]KKQ60991.1 MAG: 30S ribosomal protein S6 [Candidatus Falkowbacteria bacterium GW2011_GWC2_38_22]KKQ63480.1 MAG: 30S ribosomal protein S6 [Candidatus Falkowbacteria bacterium GW2011_GWF1_38_22]KKQ65449.1 MAG: 30S ribosomal protein S6 [Candidatus Falkowbacteria bacterium GW2011_GWE2_38_254]KKQ70244.1 MAG: 30S ribosomal protein S6 [Candidatus Falkowbacteria bacterium GW2011_GWE1_38_31]KKQ72580.1 MAG: 30S rib